MDQTAMMGKSSTMLQSLNYSSVDTGVYTDPKYSSNPTDPIYYVDPIPSGLSQEQPQIYNTTNITTTQSGTNNSLMTPRNIMIGTGVICLILLLNKK